MTVFIDDDVIERVKEASDIVDIISDYVELKKVGSNYKGLCPFHSEKTPSFSVASDKQFYHCFGCGAGGDSIEFIMNKENLEFREAVEFLAKRYNIEITGKKIDKKKVEEKDRFYEMNRDAARFFYSNLRNSPMVIRYLNSRGIMGKTINKFGLGYSLDSWSALYDFLSKKGYKDEEMEKNGLIVQRKDGKGYYDRFRNRVIFPIIDTKSKVIGFGGRVMDDSMPKYLNSKDSLVFTKGNNLYGLNLIHKHSNREKIILVEGYMDVIALFSAGINYSVASLGTSLTERQAQLLKRFGNQVYICYDSDKAGITATLRAIDVLTNEDVKPRVIALPKGKDPDDLIKEEGLLGFEKLMAKSYNYIDYKIKIVKLGYDLNKIEDKINFTIEVAEIIKSLKSPVEQDAYISKIAEETGITEDAIKEEIVNKSKKVREYNNTWQVNPNIINQNIEPKRFIKDNNHNQKTRRTRISGKVKAEMNLLKLMLEDKDYFDIIRDKLAVEEFSSECGEIYRMISGYYTDSDKVDLEELLIDSEDNPVINKLVKSLINNKLQYQSTEYEIIIDDLVQTIEYDNLDSQRNSILSDIESIEKKEDQSPEDLERFKKLCIELTDLNKKIKLIRDE